MNIKVSKPIHLLNFNRMRKKNNKHFFISFSIKIRLLLGETPPLLLPHKCAHQKGKRKREKNDEDCWGTTKWQSFYQMQITMFICDPIFFFFVSLRRRISLKFLWQVCGLFAFIYVCFSFFFHRIVRRETDCFINLWMRDFIVAIKFRIPTSEPLDLYRYIEYHFGMAAIDIFTLQFFFVGYNNPSL